MNSGYISIFINRIYISTLFFSISIIIIIVIISSS